MSVPVQPLQADRALQPHTHKPTQAKKGNEGGGEAKQSSIQTQNHHMTDTLDSETHNRKKNSGD